MKTRGGVNGMYYLDRDFLDPQYNDDFTDTDDTGANNFRGSYE